MVSLTDQQAMTVWTVLQTRQNTLTTELYDHFCCYIESQIAQGHAFDASLSLAFKEIAPNGVEELEQELDQMLSFKPLTSMKRMFYAATFVATVFLTFSVLAKSWNWQDGTEICLLAGNSTLVLLVLPTAAIMAGRSYHLLTKLDLFRTVVGVTAGYCIGVGMIFKVLSFPLANFLFNTGMIILLALFLPVFFFQMYRRAYL